MTHFVLGFNMQPMEMLKLYLKDKITKGNFGISAECRTEGYNGRDPQKSIKYPSICHHATYCVLSCHHHHVIMTRAIIDLISEPHKNASSSLPYYWNYTVFRSLSHMPVAYKRTVTGSTCTYHMEEHLILMEISQVLPLWAIRFPKSLAQDNSHLPEITNVSIFSESYVSE